MDFEEFDKKLVCALGSGLSPLAIAQRLCDDAEPFRVPFTPGAARPTVYGIIGRRLNTLRRDGVVAFTHASGWKVKAPA